MGGKHPKIVAVLAIALGAVLGCGGGEKKVTCPAGQSDCGGVCRDLTTDPVSCGSCGLQCAAGGICTGGTCSCPPPTVLCGSAGCVDTSASAAHCGSCAHACGAGNCSGGACACPAAIGVKDCGAAASPQCRVTLADRSNCGDCGVACLSGEICASGACQACAAPLDRCGNACVDLQTDAANCGACGTACGPAQSCTAGSCICPAGQDPCGAACVDLQTDAANCGACGRACPAGQACTAGNCSCTAGQTCGALCCEGTACCGAGGRSCQTKHDAGTSPAGAVFFDCNPPGSKEAAQNAALAWAPGGHTSAQFGPTCPPTECVAWENAPTPSACGVWCYAATSPWFGKVEITTIQPVCNCPTSMSRPWH